MPRPSTSLSLRIASFGFHYVTRKPFLSLDSVLKKLILTKFSCKSSWRRRRRRRRRWEPNETVYDCTALQKNTRATSSFILLVSFDRCYFHIQRLSIWFHLSVWRQSDRLIITLSCNYPFFLSFLLAFSASLRSVSYGLYSFQSSSSACETVQMSAARGPHTSAKMPEWKDVRVPLRVKIKRQKERKNKK